MKRQTFDDIRGETGVARIVITMAKSGNCKVEGAILDRDFANFMLDTARDVVSNYHNRRKLETGAAVIVPAYDTALANGNSA